MKVLVTSCNPQKFDINAHFEQDKTILWRETKACCIGDVVYVYVGRPESYLKYKCKVVDANIPPEKIDSDYYSKQKQSSRTKNKPYMRLVLIKELLRDGLALPDLLEHGLKTVQCTTEAGTELCDYLNEITENY